MAPPDAPWAPDWPALKIEIVAAIDAATWAPSPGPDGIAAYVGTSGLNGSAWRIIVAIYQEHADGAATRGPLVVHLTREQARAAYARATDLRGYGRPWIRARDA